MKSMKLLKLLLLPCAALMWSSCLLPGDVVSSGEFQPLKTLTISPDSAKVGDNIIITGENFISKKEYNQVWFSPNVKAVIDSATKTQLFLKVPEGAATGEVVVSNGAYADTLHGGIKILQKPTQTITFNFSGLKVVQQRETSSFTSGNLTNNNYIDTLNFPQVVDSVNRSDLSEIPHIVFEDGCILDLISNSRAPLNDSIFQSIRKRKSKVYTVIQFITNEKNNIYDSLQILQCESINQEGNSSGWVEIICEIKRLTLTNTTFKVINNRKIVRLNSTQFKSCLSKFEYVREYNYVNTKGSNYERSISQSLKVPEILPDAYFELTLE